MAHKTDHDESASLNALGALEQTMSSESLAPIPQRAAPGWLRFMPDVIRSLWDKGATFKMDGNSGEISLDGFYKNGPMRLLLRDEGVVAIDRRGRETNIAKFEDLVELNFQFWRQANSQKNIYVQPQRPWLDGFLDKKLVKRQVIFIPADESEGESDA
jgi:hypothetical protein